MTRDKAIEIERKKLKIYMHDKSDHGIRKMAEANIDALIELGLLKVQERIAVVNVTNPDKVRIERHGKVVYQDD